MIRKGQCVVLVQDMFWRHQVTYLLYILINAELIVVARCNHLPILRFPELIKITLLVNIWHPLGALLPFKFIVLEGKRHVVLHSSCAV